MQYPPTHWVDIRVCDVGQEPELWGRVGIVLWELHLCLQWAHSHSTHHKNRYTHTHTHIHTYILIICMYVRTVIAYQVMVGVRQGYNTVCTYELQ